MIRRRHARHYEDVAARLVAPAQSVQDEVLGHIEADLDNLRAAFRFDLAMGRSARAQAMASMLTFLWVSGRFTEGARWLDDSLDSDGESVPAARCWALSMRALLSAYLAELDSTHRADEALAIARELGEPTLLTAALHASGNAYVLTSPARALAAYEEGAALARQGGRLVMTLPQMLDGMGVTHVVRGHLAKALGFFEESLAALDGSGMAEGYIARQERTFVAEVRTWQGRLSQARWTSPSQS